MIPPSEERQHIVIAETIAASRRGRPSKVAAIEEAMGVRLEHHVMQEMSKRRTSRQIAAALKISEHTMRRHLRRRGYRIECQSRLMPIGPCEQGGG